MPSTALKALDLLIYLILTKTHETGTIIIPTLQVGKLRHGLFSSFAVDHS